MRPSPDTSTNEPGTLPAVQGNSTRWIASGLAVLGAVLIILSIEPGCLGPRLTPLGIVFMVASFLLAADARRPVLALVPIILVVASLTLAAFSPPGRDSNEFRAVSNPRTINTAEVTYLSSAGKYGAMTDLIDAKLLDDTFTGTKAGYKYSITLDATGSVYTAEALPVSTNTGRFGYYSHPDAIVRYSTNASLAPGGQSGRWVQ
jgi:hypothetical protein